MAGSTPFGRLLYAAIRKSGVSANAFAKSVGTSSGFLSNVYSGKRRPPVDRLGQRMDKLGLQGEERSEFLLQAHLMHCTPFIQKAFEEQRAVIARFREQQG